MKTSVSLEMQEPFDITIKGTIYSIFPEEEGVFTVFKEGIEYVKIQKDDNEKWLKLDPETELPRFEEDSEVEQIGQQIILNSPENPE